MDTQRIYVVTCPLPPSAVDKPLVNLNNPPVGYLVIFPLTLVRDQIHLFALRDKNKALKTSTSTLNELILHCLSHGATSFVYPA